MEQSSWGFHAVAPKRISEWGNRFFESVKAGRVCETPQYRREFSQVIPASSLYIGRIVQSYILQVPLSIGLRSRVCSVIIVKVVSALYYNIAWYACDSTNARVYACVYVCKILFVREVRWIFKCNYALCAHACRYKDEQQTKKLQAG